MGIINAIPPPNHQIVNPQLETGNCDAYWYDYFSGLSSDALAELGIRTLESFGAIGDGVTDDTAAVIAAFTQTRASKTKLLGTSGHTYKVVGLGPQLNFNDINFDGCGCTFEAHGSATGFFFAFGASPTVHAVTSLAANCAAGEAAITVASASGMAVGDLLILQVIRASGFTFALTTIIANIAGAVVSLEARIPPGLDINSGSETNFVVAVAPVVGGTFRNASFDGTNITTALSAFEVANCIGGTVENLKFNDWIGDGVGSFPGGGPFFAQACYLTIRDMFMVGCGNGGTSDFATSKCSSCNIDGIISRYAFGFGPEITSGCYNNFGSIVCNGAGLQGVTGRNVKLSAELGSTFGNITSTNASDTAFALTNGSSYNVFDNLVLVNSGVNASNSQCFWTSNGGCINNTINNIVAICETAAAAGQEIIIFPTDTGNVFNNVRVTSVDNIIDGANSYFGLVNGYPWNRAYVMPLGNGNNNDVPVPSHTNFATITGPTGAFTITGLVVGRHGQEITIVNETGQQMTLVAGSGLSIAGNRINTLNTVGDIVFPGNGAATLRYDLGISAWLVTGVNTP